MLAHAEPTTVLVEVEVVVVVANGPAPELPSSEQVEDGLLALMLVNGLHPTQGPPGVYPGTVPTKVVPLQALQGWMVAVMVLSVAAEQEV